MRTTRDVVEDHLRLAKEGRVDEDLRRNYAEDVLLVTAHRGTHRGHGGARRLATLLAEELPRARFEYTAVRFEGEVALLVWDGEGEGARVRDGVDTFVVRDGHIVAQTICYRVEREPSRA